MVANAIMRLVCDGVPFAGWDIGLAPGEVASIGLATGTVGMTASQLLKRWLEVGREF